jgi:sorting nexin-1/2
LQAYLASTYAGIIIPAAPEKQSLGRFEQEFVDNRRDGLERMMRKIVAHSTLKMDKIVRAFLEDDLFDLEGALSSIEDETKQKASAVSFISKLGDAMSSNTSGSFMKLPEPDEVRK